ncbi:hypothetical protein LV779_07975 [Streptomyces thinghirensis]|nr:hypothetical protein [Streptomyces thinghirensis]
MTHPMVSAGTGSGSGTWTSATPTQRSHPLLVVRAASAARGNEVRRTPIAAIYTRGRGARSHYT